MYPQTTVPWNAGSASRGLYRVHQFSKVEMFVLCTPQQSEALLEELADIEKEMFTELGLHFKILVSTLCDKGTGQHNVERKGRFLPSGLIGCEALNNNWHPYLSTQCTDMTHLAYAIVLPGRQHDSCISVVAFGLSPFASSWLVILRSNLLKHQSVSN